jgi:hypothetical protein
MQLRLTVTTAGKNDCETVDIIISHMGQDSWGISAGNWGTGMVGHTKWLCIMIHHFYQACSSSTAGESPNVFLVCKMLISAGSAKKSVAGYPAHNILAFSSGFNFFFGASGQEIPRSKLLQWFGNTSLLINATLQCFPAVEVLTKGSFEGLSYIYTM